MSSFIAPSAKGTTAFTFTTPPLGDQALQPHQDDLPALGHSPHALAHPSAVPPMRTLQVPMFYTPFSKPSLHQRLSTLLPLGALAIVARQVGQVLAFLSHSVRHSRWKHDVSGFGECRVRAPHSSNFSQQCTVAARS